MISCIFRLYAAFYLFIGIRATLALIGTMLVPEIEMSPRNAAFLHVPFQR